MRRYLSTAVARILLVGGQIGYIKIISKYLSPADLGTYYFYVTVSYFMNAAVFVPFDYYQQSRVSKTFNKYSSLAPLISLNVKLLAAVLLIGAASAAVASLMSPTLSQLIAISILLALSAYLPQCIRGALNILGHAHKVVLSQALEGILKPLLGLATLMWVSSGSVFAVIISNITAAAIVIAVLILSLKRAGLLTFEPHDPEFPTVLEVVKLALPISAGAFFNWVQMQAYRVILVPLGFSEIIGIYSVMSNLGQAAAGAAGQIYSQVNIPKLYQTDGAFLGRYLRDGLILIAILLAAGLILSPYLVPIVTTQAYSRFSGLVAFGILIEGIGLLGGAFTAFFTLRSKTASLGWIAAVAASFSTIAMYVLYSQGWVTPVSLGLVLVNSQLLALLLAWVAYGRQLARAR